MNDIHKRGLFLSESQFMAEIARVFVDELTEIQQRERIAASWLSGDHRYYVTFANDRGLNPIALIVASLLDVESLLFLTRAGVLRFSFLQCAQLVIFMEDGLPVEDLIIPNSSRNPVDNPLQPVDNYV